MGVLFVQVPLYRATYLFRQNMPAILISVHPRRRIRPHQSRPKTKAFVGRGVINIISTTISEIVVEIIRKELH